MVKRNFFVLKIMRAPLFLAQKSVGATEAGKQVVIDLLDILRSNLDYCVGMAVSYKIYATVGCFWGK